jgi:hypothetical protein
LRRRSWIFPCFNSPDPRAFLLRSAYRRQSFFAAILRATKFWVAHASPVLAMASRQRGLLLCARTEPGHEMAGKFVSAQRRNQVAAATATQLSRHRTRRRGGASSRYYAGSRSGRRPRCSCRRRSRGWRRGRLSWCSCRRRRRRRWLVSESTGEFRRTPNSAGKSASGNVHDVETLHDR